MILVIWNSLTAAFDQIGIISAESLSYTIIIVPAGGNQRITFNQTLPLGLVRNFRAGSLKSLCDVSVSYVSREYYIYTYKTRSEWHRETEEVRTLLESKYICRHKRKSIFPPPILKCVTSTYPRVIQYNRQSSSHFSGLQTRMQMKTKKKDASSPLYIHMRELAISNAIRACI